MARPWAENTIDGRNPRAVRVGAMGPRNRVLSMISIRPGPSTAHRSDGQPGLTWFEGQQDRCRDFCQGMRTRVVAQKAAQGMRQLIASFNDVAPRPVAVPQRGQNPQQRWIGKACGVPQLTQGHLTVARQQFDNDEAAIQSADPICFLNFRHKDLPVRLAYCRLGDQEETRNSRSSRSIGASRRQTTDLGGGRDEHTVHYV